MGEGYPAVPEAAIPEGWEPRGRSEDELFDAGGVTVRGNTVLYADARVEKALAAIGVGGSDAPADDAPETDRDDRLVGVDTVAPFGFATALSFRPPLAPGIGPATLLPMVLSEAARSFAADFRNRGFEDVTYDPHGRIRTNTGGRARMRQYAATCPLGADAPVDALGVEGWLAVWTRGTAFRVAGGGYPTAGLADLLADLPDPPPTDPPRFRDALIGLIRAVR
jgi:hypothetical protein